MKIAVCVKRVPDTEARIKIAADGKAIDESGVKFVLNPYDEYAVEEALRLKEKAGAGEVAVVSVGGDASQETIRTALAMGADRGVLLKTDAVPLDPLPVAQALADELRAGGYDLVLFGKQAVDDSSHAVGVMVAELLGVPAVGAVAKLEVGDGKGSAEREVEGGVEVVEFALPAVVTADKGLNEPRYPALKGIMAAKKKPLETKPVTLAGAGLEVIGLAYPPERLAGRIVGEGAEAVPALIAALRTEAKVLLMANVLVVLEQRDGALKRVSLEALAAGRSVADQLGGEVHAVGLGPAGFTADAAGAHGADKVFLAADDAVRLYQSGPYAATVAQQAKAGYAAVLLAATALGKDLGPRLAARLGAPLAADAIGLAVEGGAIVVSRPVYAGKASYRLRVTAAQVVISLRPNNFLPVEAARPGTVEAIAVVDAAGARTASVKEPEHAALDVAEAGIIVAGGRGLKEPQHFQLLEDLAAAFGSQAAVGASRAVVDAGWRPHAEQVGQTGKVVSPNLYVAVGVSGAIQHLAGMRTSKVIVAINKDKDAPIFKVADYGIVGDLFEVVPRLTEEVRRIRSG